MSWLLSQNRDNVSTDVGAEGISSLTLTIPSSYLNMRLPLIPYNLAAAHYLSKSFSSRSVKTRYFFPAPYSPPIGRSIVKGKSVQSFRWPIKSGRISLVSLPFQVSGMATI